MRENDMILTAQHSTAQHLVVSFCRGIDEGGISAESADIQIKRIDDTGISCSTGRLCGRCSGSTERAAPQTVLWAGFFCPQGI